MEWNPLVSIIVPNYNHSVYLEKRLNSIFNQSYENFEVIILDDASSDNSKDILFSYEKHPKIKHLLINNYNSGSTFKQWKKGIELSKGEIIWIAESDDYSDVDFLKILIFDMNRNNAVAAFSNSNWIDSDGNIYKENSEITQSLFRKFKIIEMRNFYLIREVDSAALFYNTCFLFNTSSGIFKKSCFENINDDFLDFKLCGDWLFWFNICSQGVLVYSNQKLNYFRSHQDTVRSKYAGGLIYLQEEIRIRTRISKLNKYQSITLLPEFSKQTKDLLFANALYCNFWNGFVIALLYINIEPDFFLTLIKLVFEKIAQCKRIFLQRILKPQI